MDQIDQMDSHQKYGLFAGAMAFVIILILLFLARDFLEMIIDSDFVTYGIVLIALIVGLGVGFGSHNYSKHGDVMGPSKVSVE